MAEPSPPPHVPGHAVRIVSVPHAGTLTVLFVGGYRSTLMHFVARRTMPCLGTGPCPPTRHAVPTRYYAYAPAYRIEPDTNLLTPIVLEITEALELQLRGEGLAGGIWRLSRRASRGKNGGVMGVFVRRLPGAERYPQPPVVQIVQAFYREPAMVWDVDNPVPEAVFMDRLPGPAEIDLAIPPREKPKPVTEEQLETLRKMRERSTNGAGVPHGATPQEEGKGE